MRIFLFTIILLIIFSCEPDDDLKPPVSPNPEDTTVVFNADEVPYPTLSEYHFFTGNLSDMNPAEGVLPYEVITPLFSDYAHKKRFVWMPEGTTASYAGDHTIFDFPEGTVLIKNFYYDNVQPSGNRRIVETRLMYKIGTDWFFAEYVWNDAQNEALLDMNGSFTNVQWIKDNGEEENINYRIPSYVECLTCHKNNEKPIPIGPKPQNINSNFSYKEGVQNQLQKWLEKGYLDSVPGTITTVVDWQDQTQTLEKRVRAYLDINCAHCHRDSSHCAYRAVRFAYDETSIEGNMGVCVEPDELIDPSQQHIISPGRPDRSMLYYRVKSTDPASMMPLLGRTLVHKEGAALIKQYILSLNDEC